MALPGKLLTSFCKQFSGQLRVWIRRGFENGTQRFILDHSVDLGRNGLLSKPYGSLSALNCLVFSSCSRRPLHSESGFFLA